jgi:hypothetical protein
VGAHERFLKCGRELATCAKHVVVPKEEADEERVGLPYTLFAEAPAISATHFEYNPLMCRYFREVGLSRKELANRRGVRYYRVYVARTQSVRLNNAEKISRGMAHNLDLSEQERLEPKAGIIGHHGDRVLAYFGFNRRVMKLLGVSGPTALELVDLEIL